VFGRVLGLLTDHGLVEGKRVGVDATALEASTAGHALNCAAGRDTSESYEEVLTELTKTSGIATPSREQLARLDRKHKKRTSNKKWKSLTGADARVTKMKHGRTCLAYKAEHAVDLDTGAVVAVTLQEAYKGDTTTPHVTLCGVGETVGMHEAEVHPDSAPKVNVDGIEEVVAGKGYDSAALLERVKNYQVRSYIPERQQKGQRKWEGKAGQQQAVYATRRRIQGNYGKSLLRHCSEHVERSFAHCCDTGGMRRTHLRKHANILKRQLIHVAGFDLNLIFRKLLDTDTPREWNNCGGALLLQISSVFSRFLRRS
jgi:transposase